MKKISKIAALLLVTALLFPVLAAAENYSSILVQSMAGTVSVAHSDGSGEELTLGQILRNGDRITVSPESNLQLLANGDRHIYAGENTVLQLLDKEGKTGLFLESGDVLCRLDNNPRSGEAFRIQTPSATVSARGMVFRVKMLQYNDREYTLVEAFSGSVELLIDSTREIAVLGPGEAGLVETPGDILESEFVRLDEIDLTHWSSKDVSVLPLGKEGVGTPKLPIPYEKLPKHILEALLAIRQDGQELVLSADALKNLADTGHNYLETILDAPTCTEAGESSFHCIFCGHSYSVATPAMGHEVCTSDGRTATCVQAGLTSGSYCGICGLVFQPQTEIPMSGHTVVDLEGYAPTCIQQGLTTGRICNVCGRIFELQEFLPLTEHTPSRAEGYVPTCTQNGMTDGKICSVCGEILERQTEIPMLPHTPAEKKGYASTCTQPGLTDGSICAVCGTVLEAQKELPLAEHVPAEVLGYAPTCTQPGLTDGIICRICGGVLEVQEEIPVAPHNPVPVSGFASTCTQPGLSDGIECSVCGQILEEQRELPLIAHTAAIKPGYPATVDSDGLSDGAYCTACDAILQEQTVIPALRPAEEESET